MNTKSHMSAQGIDRPRSRLSERQTLGSERGQGMTEYIILVLLVGLVCMPIAQLLPRAAKEYLRPFYYSVSRPIP